MRIRMGIVIALAGAIGYACAGPEDQATSVEAPPASGSAPQTAVEATGSATVEQGVPEPGPEYLGRTTYQETVAQADNSDELVSLCRLVRTTFFAGMGLYVVDRLTGYYEELIDRPGESGGFTYVEMTLLDAWYQAEKHPVARIVGGPGPDGGGSGWFVDLKVGEPVGVFLMDPRPQNRDYPDLFELGIFTRSEDGGYTNGQLFTRRVVDEHELGQLVKGLAGGAKSDPCPYDEAPDVYEAPPTPTDPNETPPTDVPQPGVPDGDM